MGERWTADSRLPDFSHAGYHEGERVPPTVPVVANVRDFGAKGDGRSDDTEAFLEALSKSKPGAILVPAGRYKITQILPVHRSGVVLRGEGMDKTILQCPIPLETIRPNPGKTTSGKPTSNYSWSGGIVDIKGKAKVGKPVDITARSERGSTRITVREGHDFQAGDRVVLQMVDDSKGSLLSQVYSGDPGPTAKIRKPIRIQLHTQIEEIDGTRITLDRPLRLNLDPRWKPTVSTWRSTVSESGIEGLTFEFPNQPYGGHFSELGFNAIAMGNVEDCWARNIHIRNADSGIFAKGVRLSLLNITLSSQRKVDKQQCTGHHGIMVGSEVLCHGFDFRTRFIHDITMTAFHSGSVFSSGKAVDFSMDHHCRGPFENLITNVDAGEGSRLWKCGGGKDLGKHCAARGTFWNIRTKRPQKWPFSSFGPPSMNLVGLTTKEESQLNPEGRWFEAIPPEELIPANLHEAQLTRRMGWSDPGDVRD